MNICTVLDPGGAPSSTAAMGLTKTVSIDSPFAGIVIIEAKCGADWVPVPGLSFQAPGSKSVDALFQEVRVAGGFTGAPSISISAEDEEGVFVDLPFGGAAVDTDALGSENTILVSGLNAGDLLKIETSDDNVNWAEACTFQADGLQTLTVVACWMRVEYSGSGAPAICVGAPRDNYGQLLGSAYVEWRYQAPADKLGGPAYANFYDAFDEAKRLYNMGYRSVTLMINGDFATDTLIYDPGGPDEDLIANVCVVTKRPGDADTTYDMTGIKVEASFDANRSDSETTVTFEDNSRWTKWTHVQGYRLRFIGSSFVPFTGMEVARATGTLDGARTTFFSLEAGVAPILWVPTGNFGVLFTTPNAIFSTVFGKDNDPSLAPVFDINGAGFAALEWCNRGVIANTITDNVGGGFLQIIDQVGNMQNSWDQPGLASATVVVQSFVSGYQRQSSPTVNLREFTAADSPVDLTALWGPTVLCNTVQGPIEILMPTCDPCSGETFEIKDIGGNFLEVAGAASPNGDVLYEAPRHDVVTIVHVLAGNNTPFSIVVVATEITVNIETDGGGLALTDAATAAAALNLDAAVVALGVTAAGQGTGVALLVAAGSAPLVTQGRAGTNNITLTPIAGQFVEDAVISVDSESRVLRSQAPADWHRLQG